ncbi:VOC family protein [Leucobacter triazinivorans]|uniref:VOC family protein n=1 Tax=Leucobacter triazinivorans TaxID=1784719 RepID=A0A4V0Z1H4_9MICO|nr:VOC family protein [Leucobacter triazinivorans]QBE48419.1 VOC family protein [Leucobacter triazinivorans]
MAATSSTPRSRILVLVSVAAVVAAGIGAIVWGVVVSSRSSATNVAPSSALPDDTAMGVVELSAHDLPKVRAYYEDAVGLTVLSETQNEVVLGLDEPLLRVTSGAGGESGSTLAEAGLYHSAILYPDAASLASTLVTLASVAPDSFQGSADHAVSQAFYFLDPEGNGLELYIDRPRSEWRWSDGEVQMGSAQLDPAAFIQEHLGAESVDPDAATMGHVHLKVGDLDEARAFYADALGFAVTSQTDGALFYAAGGYHHHLATNTWQSAGAGTRTNATGLGSLTITIPDDGTVDEIADRLDAAGHDSERSDSGLSVEDPWGNLVRIAIGGAGA